MRKIKKNIDLEEAIKDGNHWVMIKPASKKYIKIMKKAEIGTDNGKSDWLWITLPNGDLIFGCFPQGDTCEIVSQGDAFRSYKDWSGKYHFTLTMKETK